MLCPEIPLCHSLSLSVKLLFPLAFLSKYLKTKLLKTLRLLHYGMQLQRINSNAKHFFPFLFLNYSELVYPDLCWSSLTCPLWFCSGIDEPAIQWHEQEQWSQQCQQDVGSYRDPDTRGGAASSGGWEPDMFYLLTSIYFIALCSNKAQFRLWYFLENVKTITPNFTSLVML